VKLWRKITVIGLLVVLFIPLVIFSYHTYQLYRERELLEEVGNKVSFGKKHLNVYTEGKGEKTFVFMSGSGIAAPVWELRGLYQRFSKDNKIAVVERAGYGYSSVFEDTRDLDQILEQSRKALRKSGLKPPYVLVPHSISGLEAIYWAQKYPDEVQAIIALDIGLPEQYATYKMKKAQRLQITFMNGLTRLGFQRLFPSATYDPEVIKQHFLTDKEKERFKAISYKQAFNNDMKQELLKTEMNAKKSVSLPPPTETPILFFSAYTKENKITQKKEADYQRYAKQLLNAKVERVKGKHAIYLYKPSLIYKEAIAFINEDVSKGR